MTLTLWNPENIEKKPLADPRAEKLYKDPYMVWLEKQIPKDVHFVSWVHNLRHLLVPIHCLSVTLYFVDGALENFIRVLRSKPTQLMYLLLTDDLQTGITQDQQDELCQAKDYFDLHAQEITELFRCFPSKPRESTEIEKAVEALEVLALRLGQAIIPELLDDPLMPDLEKSYLWYTDTRHYGLDRPGLVWRLNDDTIETLPLTKSPPWFLQAPHLEMDTKGRTLYMSKSLL